MSAQWCFLHVQFTNCRGCSGRAWPSIPPSRIFAVFFSFFHHLGMPGNLVLCRHHSQKSRKRRHASMWRVVSRDHRTLSRTQWCTPVTKSQSYSRIPSRAFSSPVQYTLATALTAHQYEKIKRYTPKRLVELLRDEPGPFQLLDVRPTEAYKTTRIVGMLTYPLETLEKDMVKLNKDFFTAIHCDKVQLSK